MRVQSEWTSVGVRIELKLKVGAAVSHLATDELLVLCLCVVVLPHSTTARFFELHSNHTVMLTVAHASYIWLQPNGDEFVGLQYTAPTRFYKRIFTVVRVVCCQLMTQAFRKTHKHTLHTLLPRRRTSED